MTQFYSNSEAARWNSLVDEDNKLATIYKQYQHKTMMDEDLRSCDMWLFVVQNEGIIDTIYFCMVTELTQQ